MQVIWDLVWPPCSSSWIFSRREDKVWDDVQWRSLKEQVCRGHTCSFCCHKVIMSLICCSGLLSPRYHGNDGSKANHQRAMSWDPARIWHCRRSNYPWSCLVSPSPVLLSTPSPINTHAQTCTEMHAHTHHMHRHSCPGKHIQSLPPPPLYLITRTQRCKLNNNKATIYHITMWILKRVEKLIHVNFVLHFIRFVFSCYFTAACCDGMSMCL